MKKKTFFLAAIAALAAVATSAFGADTGIVPVLAGLGLHVDPATLGLAALAGTTAIDPEKVSAELKRIGDDVRAFAEKSLAEIKASGKMHDDTRAKVDELLLEHGKTQANLQHAQQALAKLEANGAGGDVQHVSLGRQFVDSESVKAFIGHIKPRGRVDMEVNAAITTLTTDADGSAGDLVRSTRVPGIITPPQRRMTVRDLLTPGTMDGNTLEYVKETGFTNAAAPVAEGAAKPESTIKFDAISTTAKVIAHWVKASRQIMDDASQLASYIDGRLRYGLAFKEEQQLLNGDGTGQNLLGIIPQATPYAAPITISGATTIDKLRLAMLQAFLAEYPATGHVLNPIDWAGIELLKDTTGRYIIGNPQGAIGATLWNLPVVETQAMGVGKFLTGAFKLGAQVFDRWLARVELATENGNDFTNNMVTILAEERLALAVYRPEAFVYGSLT